MRRASNLAEAAVHDLSSISGEQLAVLHELRVAVEGLEGDTAMMWERVEYEGKQRAMEMVSELEVGMKRMRGQFTEEV